MQAEDSIAENFCRLFGFGMVKGRVLEILADYEELSEYGIRMVYFSKHRTSADQSISQSLKELVTEGFVEVRDSGNKRLYRISPPWHPNNPYTLFMETAERLANSVAERIEKRYNTTICMQKEPQVIGPFKSKKEVDSKTMDLIAYATSHVAFCGDGHWGKDYRRDIEHGQFVYKRMSNRIKEKIIVLLSEKTNVANDNAMLLRSSGADVRFINDNVRAKLLEFPLLESSRLRANLALMEDIPKSYSVIPRYAPKEDEVINRPLYLQICNFPCEIEQIINVVRKRINQCAISPY